MSTSLETSLLEEAGRFEGYRELLEDDLETTEPDEEVFSRLKLNLDEFKKQYLNLKVAQTKFKAKVVPKVISEEEFNAYNSSYKYTDTWIETKRKEYQNMTKNVAVYLKKGKLSSNIEEKVQVDNTEDVKKLSVRITKECQQVQASIDDTFTSLESLDSITVSQAQVYKDLKADLISVIDSKIPILLKTMNDLAKSETACTVDKEELSKINTQFDIFESSAKTKLYKMVQLLADKITNSSQPSSTGSSVKSEAIHLKKTDPPSFSGKEEDYPEFYRKWAAIVTPARLPEEAEIDRLREAIPKEAEEMLIGVTKLNKAWEILKKRYGNEDLIAVKLKNDLKSLNIPAGLDHERIIALSIKVRSLVTRLQHLKASEALRYDGEFVAAIYFQLPNRHKQEWLKYDKTLHSDKWTSLMNFLEDCYEKAVEEKLLLATLNPVDARNSGNAGVAAAVIGENNTHVNNSTSQINDKFEGARLKAGKCPVCSSEHTFRTRWTNSSWPSDRFITCRKFNDMTPKQRAETIERVGGCPRCTSWLHDRTQCRSQLIDCKELINGVRCHKDHSRLVCNSGVAYCLSTLTESSRIDVYQPTLHYLQDVSVNDDDQSARLLWDNGSNRVLISHEFAAERNLRNRMTSITMKVVGGSYKKVNTRIYELDLVDRQGRKHSIWGYGIDRIIDPDDPIDLTPV